MARSAYLTFRPKTAALSLLAGIVVVPVFALLAKAIVEGTTDLVYTIHWLETVPLLVLLVALAVNGWLNERASREQEDR